MSEKLSLSKLKFNLDSAWSSILETNPMKALVHVNGVLAGHHFTHGGGLLLLAGHFILF